MPQVRLAVSVKTRSLYASSAAFSLMGVDDAGDDDAGGGGAVPASTKAKA